MATFVSVNLDKRADLVLGGVGPLSTPLSERDSAPSPNETVTIANSELVINVPEYATTLRYSGDNIASSGSGDLYGLSGTIHQETNMVNGAVRYILSGFSLSPVDYFLHTTWESLFSGEDQIFASNVDDHINTFTGNDYIEAKAGNDVIDAGYGFDTIYAGQGNDSIQGGYNGDLIYGEEGDDDLRGGNGLDLIVGGVGNDTIRGAKGTDTLTGGEGSDVFVFERELDGVINIDTITDFVSGADRIELSAFVFTALSGQVGQNVGLSQYIKYNAATGVLSYDADGSGSGVALAFAVLGATTHPLSVATDMWVVA